MIDFMLINVSIFSLYGLKMNVGIHGMLKNENGSMLHLLNMIFASTPVFYYVCSCAQSRQILISQNMSDRQTDRPIEG